MAKNLQTVARRALTPCAGSDAFRFADASAARDLGELRHILSLRSLHLVAHHAEHYHAWIRDILGDPALARKVERLAPRAREEPEDYRRELLATLDERIGQLRLRVL